MAKQSGMGDACYVGGYDLSGDINSLGSVAGGPALLESTGINKSAMERMGGLRSGAIEIAAFFNDAAGQEHAALKTLPTVDTHIAYFRGTTLGNPAAVMVAKQINYDGNRAADGGFTFAVQGQANGYGLEWGRSLTAGTRTDTTATNGTSIDTTASADFGIQAYLQVLAFTGTSVTVTVQDSANDSTFASISGLGSFTAVSAAPAFERIASSNTTTVRRYLRVATTGTFSNAAFVVVVVKNEAAGVAF